MFRKQNSRNSYIGKLLCFILAPFLTFIYCFKSIHLKSSRFIFFLWGLLFAWSMHYTNYEQGIDMLEIIREFYNYPFLSFNDVVDSFSGMFSDDGDIRPYNTLVFWITRLFSNNYHFMYFIASIPFMYFMIKAIGELLRGVKGMNLVLFLALILFLMPKDFFSIQNFRFSTATWIAVYSTIQYFYNSKKKYLILILASYLVHSSFLIYSFIVITFLLFVKAIKLDQLKQFYYFSIPFAFLSADIFSQLDFSFLPGAFQRWINSYFSDESFEVYGNMAYLNGSGFFFINVFFNLLKTFTYIYLPLKVLQLNKKYSLRIHESSLFAFFLFLFIFCNLVQCVPSLGVRYFGLVKILSIFIWIKYVPMNAKTCKYIYLLFVACSYELIFEILKHDFMVQDIDFFFNNLISLIVKFYDVSKLV